MRIRKSQYINLKDCPDSMADAAEKKYRLFSPLVQLSGARRETGWKPSRGIWIECRERKERDPWIDISSILRSVIYGISFLVYVIGNLFKSPRDGGQLNGGQA